MATDEPKPPGPRTQHLGIKNSGDYGIADIDPRQIKQHLESIDQFYGMDKKLAGGNLKVLAKLYHHLEESMAKTSSKKDQKTVIYPARGMARSASGS